LYKISPELEVKRVSSGIFVSICWQHLWDAIQKLMGKL